jgi:hypothetical protein
MFVTEEQLQRRLVERQGDGRRFVRDSVHVVCSGDSCVLKRPTASRSGTFNTVAVSTTPIPPYATRMIVAQVEVGHFSIPTCDVDVAFEPTEPIGVGGVELPCAVFTMAAGNDKPWVYLLARNNSRVTRYLKAGERVGTTTTEFSATAMTGRMQHGDRNCGITCADALNSDCLCKTVDDRPPGRPK